MARHFGATRRVNDAWRVEEGGGRMKSGGTFHARALARRHEIKLIMHGSPWNMRLFSAFKFIAPLFSFAGMLGGYATSDKSLLRH